MAKASGDGSTRVIDGNAGHDSAPPARNVFVISPIGHLGTPEHRRARQVLDYIIKKAFFQPHWEVIRADDEHSPDSITSQVIERIVNSDLIVADLTGHNPNVFYELAVAHGYQKPVLYLMTEGESLPFDLIDQRAIFYNLADPAAVDKAISGLVSSQRWVEEHSSNLRTPLTMHGRFTAISEAAPGSDGNEAIASALEEMLFRLHRLERSVTESRRQDAEAGSNRDGVYSRRYKSAPVPPFASEDGRTLLEQLAIVEAELKATDELPLEPEVVVHRRNLQKEQSILWDRLTKQ